MESGKLRHRVAVQTATEAQDAHGQAIKTWADTAKVWASIEPLRGREYIEARQTTATVTHRIRLRHRALTVGQRITHAGRVFNVESVLNPAERDVLLEVMCQEVV